MSDDLRVVPKWRQQFEARRLARALLALLAQLEAAGALPEPASEEKDES